MAAAAQSGRRVEIVWEPQSGPQTALLTCPCFEVFFGGARGGGKTDGMLGEFASHADLYGEFAIGLMVRRQLTELKETIERSKQLYGPLGWTWHEQDKMWRASNGARLRFAYLERDSDADAYQGHSYTRVYVEEAGTFPDPTPIYKLIATLRSGAGVPCGIRLTGNPGGPGQQWVKARYIDPCPQGWDVQVRKFKNPFKPDEIIERDWVYIPSRVTDNRYLGGEYIAGLQMVGSAELVRAWLEGDWDVVEGAYFDCWSSRMILRPFEIPKHWTRLRSFDWGSARPFSVGWWAVASEPHSVGEFQIPRGAMVRYREWYGSSAPNVGLKLDAEQVARGIVEREGQQVKPFGECDDAVADTSIFDRDGGPPIAERMMIAGVKFRPADKRRIPGWDQMRARMIGEDGKPMIYVFSTCANSVRTIPALQHDEKKPEDLDTEAEDHAADEWRYACMSRPYTAPPPEPKDKPVEIALPTFNDLMRRQQRKYRDD